MVPEGTCCRRWSNSGTASEQHCKDMARRLQDPSAALTHCKLAGRLGGSRFSNAAYRYLVAHGCKLGGLQQSLSGTGRQRGPSDKKGSTQFINGLIGRAVCRTEIQHLCSG
jgi:hypothetical protein